MEEKERYIIDRFDEDIFDTKKEYYPSNQTICEIINKQDKRIKELEQENLSLQEQSIRDNQNWIEETTQLKQQLLDLPNKIVEEVKDDLLDFSNGWWRYFMTDGCEYMLSSDLQGCLDEIIDTILKKYGEKDESNND